MSAKADSFVARLDRRLYPGVTDNWDDVLFRERILAELREDMVVLDVGAGSGLVPHMNFRGLCAHIIGIDPDERVVENGYLDEAHVGFADSLPFEDDRFDLVFSDNVLEHLDNPASVFAEVRRVLKPGGRFLVKTPNKHHYVALIATITPHAYHRFFNALRGRPRTDTFPTRYRANSPGTMRRLAEQAGLDVISIDLIESRPEYLRITWPTYLVGWAYERLVNSSSFLAPLRVLLTATFAKPDAFRVRPDRRAAPDHSASIS